MTQAIYATFYGICTDHRIRAKLSIVCTASTNQSSENWYKKYISFVVMFRWQADRFDTAIYRSSVQDLPTQVMWHKFLVWASRELLQPLT